MEFVVAYDTRNRLNFHPIMGHICFCSTACLVRLLSYRSFSADSVVRIELIREQFNNSVREHRNNTKSPIKRTRKIYTQTYLIDRVERSLVVVSHRIGTENHNASYESIRNTTTS